MEEIKLSPEQYQALKEEIKAELLAERTGAKKNNPMCAVEHKYHDQLIDINHGQTGSIIQRMTAYLMGEKYMRWVLDERKAAEIAEDLCQKVIKAFKENNHEGI